MKYINVYLDKRGLWSASLCKGSQELESLGGSYPKAHSTAIDAKSRWGKDLEVKTSYGPLFISEDLKGRIITLLEEGVDTEVVAKRFNINTSKIRAIKAHATRGTYFKRFKGMV
jgi:hypothetical protein